MTPIVTGPQQYSHMPQGVPSHVLEADPSHSQLHMRLSRAATRKPGAIPGVPHRLQGMPHHYSASGSRPELDVVLNAACHWREQPLAVAEATTRSTRRASSRAGRRHVVTPARIGRPHAAAAVTRQHRSHKQPPSRARLEITRPVRRRPLARGHVAPRLDGRLPKLTALSYLGLAPPPHSSP